MSQKPKHHKPRVQSQLLDQDLRSHGGAAHNVVERLEALQRDPLARKELADRVQARAEARRAQDTSIKAEGGRDNVENMLQANTPEARAQRRLELAQQAAARMQRVREAKGALEQQAALRRELSANRFEVRRAERDRAEAEAAAAEAERQAADMAFHLLAGAATLLRLRAVVLADRARREEEGKFEKGILMIQRLWRGRTQRLKYRAVLQAARTIQTFWLTHIRPVQLARKRAAAQLVMKFLQDLDHASTLELAIRQLQHKLLVDAQHAKRLAASRTRQHAMLVAQWQRVEAALLVKARKSMRAAAKAPAGPSSGKPGKPAAAQASAAAAPSSSSAPVGSCTAASSAPVPTEVKGLVAAACMRLKQRAFQQAAALDWRARARNALAFKRQAALDQARVMLDRSFSAFSREQVVHPVSYPALAGPAELQAVMQLGCILADQAEQEREASKVQAADLRRNSLVPAAKRGSAVKPARPGSAAMGPENKEGKLSRPTSALPEPVPAEQKASLDWRSPEADLEIASLAEKLAERFEQLGVDLVRGMCPNLEHFQPAQQPEVPRAQLRNSDSLEKGAAAFR